ncbi:11792_t:CDS:2 [Entrophospora sp. SA101]|nr:11792_t:CDS:2 [Entrophospora sp. SA101]
MSSLIWVWLLSDANVTVVDMVVFVVTVFDIGVSVADKEVDKLEQVEDDRFLLLFVQEEEDIDKEVDKLEQVEDDGFVSSLVQGEEN